MLRTIKRGQKKNLRFINKSNAVVMQRMFYGKKYVVRVVGMMNRLHYPFQS